MKNCLCIFALPVLLATTTAAAKVKFGRRRLEDGADEGAHQFLVSQDDESLCITANGLGDSLTLQECDFQVAPPEQTWKQRGVDGNRFVSGLNEEYCMMVNHGTTIFEGVRLRLGLCESSQTEFEWDDASLYIYQTQMCLTSQGKRTEANDKILAKQCVWSRLDYKWKFVPLLGPLYQLYTAQACVQPKNGEATHRNDVVLDECDEDQVWHVQEQGQPGVVLLASALDPAVCLQAGYGAAAAVDGTPMRLANCDADEAFQRFFWDDGFEAPIVLAEDRDLCMVYQGKTAEIGDNLLMKDCAVRTLEWSGDAV